MTEHGIIDERRRVIPHHQRDVDCREGDFEPEDTLVARHTLSITPDYVLNWGVWEAVRELLQNAIDQKNTNPHSAVVFDYTAKRPDANEGFLIGLGGIVPARESLVVGATNCKLEPKSLLLGQTTKALKDKLIGQFGEGYKLALLVLCRLGYKVVIHNNDETWHPSFNWSDEYGCEVLTIERHRVHEDDDNTPGVLFEIEGVTEEDWAKITERFLGVEEPVSAILDADHLRKKVFVCGLYVCEIEELEYGYNFAAGDIKLDRDRSVLPTFDVAIAASNLWERSGNHKALYDGLKGGSLDTQYCHGTTSSQNDYIMRRHLEDHGPDVIPVSGETEAKALEDVGVVVHRVPTMMRGILRKVKQYAITPTGTPTERLELFAKLHFGFLHGEKKRDWDAIIEASKKWRGPGGITQTVSEV